MKSSSNEYCFVCIQQLQGSLIKTLKYVQTSFSTDPTSESKAE